VNIVILAGRLGKDPESKALPSGKTVVNFSLATEDGFGQNKHTNWHNITCFDKTADAVTQYTAKGSQVAVTGRVDYRSWDDKDGNKKYRTEIIADRVEFLGTKPRDEFNQETNYREPATQEVADDLDVAF